MSLGLLRRVTIRQRNLLEKVLPLRVFSIEDVIEKVRWIQKRNHLAFLAHKNKQVKLSL